MKYNIKTGEKLLKNTVQNHRFTMLLIVMFAISSSIIIPASFAQTDGNPLLFTPIVDRFVDQGHLKHQSIDVNLDALESEKLDVVLLFGPRVTLTKDYVVIRDDYYKWIGSGNHPISGANVSAVLRVDGDRLYGDITTYSYIIVPYQEYNPTIFIHGISQITSSKDTTTHLWSESTQRSMHPSFRINPIIDGLKITWPPNLPTTDWQLSIVESDTLRQVTTIDVGNYSSYVSDSPVHRSFSINAGLKPYADHQVTIYYTGTEPVDAYDIIGYTKTQTITTTRAADSISGSKCW